MLSFVGTRISVALSEGAPTEFIAVKLPVLYLSVTIARGVITSVALLTKLVSTVTVRSKVILQRVGKAGFSRLSISGPIAGSPSGRRLKDIVIVLGVRAALDRMEVTIIRFTIVA